MKKDKKWFVDKWTKERDKAAVHDPMYHFITEFITDVKALDEPEVLSQEWIDKNVVHVRGFGDIFKAEDVENLLVPKQDLPVVPTWFDEWWKDVTKGGGNLFHNIERFYNELYSSGMKEACDYISSPGNKKKLLNIIINELDYEVEDKQKYFVSSRESVGFWFLSKNNDNEVVIGTNKDYYDRKWESLKLTEEEIKDYDSRYWAFAVKVEELGE